MNNPKERSVEFPKQSADHDIMAILDGRKTQLRLQLNPHPPKEFCQGDVAAITNGNRWAIGRSAFSQLGRGAWPPDPYPGLLCPNGKPGDRLWVRESHAFSVIDPEGFDWREDPDNWDVVYRADTSREGLNWRNAAGEVIPPPWRRSIHMPRWASRILLEITDVRVERLQDISDKDALAEGIEIVGGETSCEPYRNYRAQKGMKGRNCSSPYASFQTLWTAINGDPSWLKNPWVWVVEFKRLETSQ